MNFKTTIILIVLLVAVGVLLYVTRDHGTAENSANAPQAAAAAVEKKFVELPTNTVTRIVITPSDGKAIALQRTAPNTWRMSQPVNAPADSGAVDALLSSITSANSRGSVDASSASSEATGLDHPAYVVELTDTAGKATKIEVGNRAAIGGNVYAKREGDAQPQLVAVELVDALEKQPEDFREKRLVTVQTPEVRQIKVATTQGTVELKKNGEDWEIVQGPTTMPADSMAASDLVMALTGLRADEFVNENPASTQTAQRYQLDHPAVTVSYVAVPAALPTPAAAAGTQPATAPASQPAEITGTVRFGRYDGVLRKDVFVASSESGALAKVPASSLQAFEKTPLDLRDKRVLAIDPDKVEKLTIATEKPATLNPPRAASSESVTLVRAAGSTAGPATSPGPATPSPTTAPLASSEPTPATQVAGASSTTHPTTAPAEPPSKWQFASASPTQQRVDDQKVQALLALLNPLRAEKFLETPPTTQPAEKYTLTVTTAGPAPQTDTITITDPGTASTASPIADYNGLRFEVERTLVDRLSGGFEKRGAAAPTTAPSPAISAR